MSRRHPRAALGRGALAGVLAVAVSAAAPTPTPTPPSARATASWSEEIYNPHPVAEDLVLPMPCGGAMVFRPVQVMQSSPLDDETVMLGSPDEALGFLGGRREDHLAAPFPSRSDPLRRVYYIGKYEVSRAQFGVLTAPCREIGAPDLLPQTKISWFEALDFANRYSEWLLTNARARLPSGLDGTPGFVRLPTEAEWEYAARGGLAVERTAFSARTFPMPNGKLADYVAHQGTDSANGALQPVGNLLPNPLGLHDMLGNAAEMVFEPFRLNRSGRLHGLAGGFVVRGGDYTVPGHEIRTAWRQEIAYYDPTGKANRSDRYGFRLVFAGLSLPTGGDLRRIEALRAQYEQLPRLDDTEASRGGEQAMATLKAAAVSAGTGSDLGRRLATALSDLEAAHTELNLARDRTIRSAINNGAFLALHVRDDANRLALLDQTLTLFDGELRKGRERLERGRAEGLVNKEAEEKMAGFLAKRAEATRTRELAVAALDRSLSHYADNVIELSHDASRETLEQQGARVVSELVARKHEDLVPPARVYLVHIELYRKSGSIEKKKLLNDIGGLRSLQNRQ